MADTQPDAIPDKAAKTAVDEFMLAEYQSIAAAHFDLHNWLRQNFRFYLGLIAAPVTVFAVYKDPGMEVFNLPEVMLFLFSVISVLGFLMFLNMINTRFDIILYTRTVNGVRAYFKVRADESGNTAFESGRKLPLDKNKPPYNEGWNRAYTWLFILIGFVNSAYFYVVLKNLERAHVFVTWRWGVREGRFVSFVASLRVPIFESAEGKKGDSRNCKFQIKMWAWTSMVSSPISLCNWFVSAAVNITFAWCHQNSALRTSKHAHQSKPSS